MYIRASHFHPKKKKRSESQRIPLPLVIGGSYQAQNLWTNTFGAGESRELIFPIRDVHVAFTWHWLTCQSNDGNFERPMSVIEGAISRTLQKPFFFFFLLILCDWVRGSTVVGTTVDDCGPPLGSRTDTSAIKFRWNDDCVRHDDGIRRNQLSFLVFCLCLCFCPFPLFYFACILQLHTLIITCTLYNSGSF